MSPTANPVEEETFEATTKTPSAAAVASARTARRDPRGDDRARAPAPTPRPPGVVSSHSRNSSADTTASIARVACFAHGDAYVARVVFFVVSLVSSSIPAGARGSLGATSLSAAPIAACATPQRPHVSANHAFSASNRACSPRLLSDGTPTPNANVRMGFRVEVASPRPLVRRLARRRRRTSRARETRRARTRRARKSNRRTRKTNRRRAGRPRTSRLARGSRRARGRLRRDRVRVRVGVRVRVCSRRRLCLCFCVSPARASGRPRRERRATRARPPRRGRARRRRRSSRRRGARVCRTRAWTRAARSGRGRSRWWRRVACVGRRARGGGWSKRASSPSSRLAARGMSCVRWSRALARASRAAICGVGSGGEEGVGRGASETRSRDDDAGKRGRRRGRAHLRAERRQSDRAVRRAR